ncbi:unnamed protein product [Victoria cruziana]
MIFLVRASSTYTSHSYFRLSLLIYAEMQNIIKIQATKEHTCILLKIFLGVAQQKEARSSLDQPPSIPIACFNPPLDHPR